MRVLFLGDIYGRSGRQAVKHFVPILRQKEKLDLVVANAENARHGSGMNINIYDELMAVGVDWLTGGNHSWVAAEFLPFMDDKRIKIIRPANFNKLPGRGMVTFKIKNQYFTLINLLGRVFINYYSDNPFFVFDQLYKKAKGFILVDFHAEATSEKNAFGLYANGRAGAVLGTHTHVQTSDERILSGGTAYITDAGMCGPQDGVIGADYEEVIKVYTRGLAHKLFPAEGTAQLNGVIIETKGTKAIAIKRVFEVL